MIQQLFPPLPMTLQMFIWSPMHHLGRLNGFSYSVVFAFLRWQQAMPVLQWVQSDALC